MAMTAVKPLQRKGKPRPGQRFGQRPHLFPHLRHNPLNAIKMHNNPFCGKAHTPPSPN